MNIIDPYMRSLVYKTLSQLYQYPEPAGLNRFQAERRQLAELLDAGTADSGPGEASEAVCLCNAICNQRLEPMQVEYVRLFDYRPTCPPFQSAVVKMEQDNPAQLYLLIESCYREFGLGANPDFRDPPDHISMELEFMHYLSHEEGQAMEDDVPEDEEKYRGAQKTFIDSHIMAWVPQFASSLETHARIPFFRSLARITGSFIANEARYLASFQPAI
ncbi:molecular chaperone [Desulfosarcina ovata]|uniref:Chaperone TorD n=1 Tax=Desulfosarcina ovata subsp. ovata TaxID=2752305 RepID=A0A5K8AK56_9BACT|nr:molecular chaperone TorD family protein [Desulfosarcina ovata]BBO93107.1 chaperone TorD [Desulfosarcina ovata subsp. ovata]